MSLRHRVADAAAQRLAARRSVDAALLVAAWASRLEDILPSDEFCVEAEQQMLRIRGIGPLKGASMIGSPGLVLRLPLPESYRLKLLFEDECRDLQHFVTRVRHEPWPFSDAEPDVSVDDQTIRISWRSPADRTTVLSVPPIERAEVGPVDSGTLSNDA